MTHALQTIRDYPVNSNSDPDTMAAAIEAMQQIAAKAIDDDVAAMKNARAAMAGLVEQVDQMSGMFDDDDSAIANAVADIVEADQQLANALSGATKTGA